MAPKKIVYVTVKVTEATHLALSKLASGHKIPTLKLIDKMAAYTKGNPKRVLHYKPPGPKPQPKVEPTAGIVEAEEVEPQASIVEAEEI